MANTPANVSAFINDAGYLTKEIDENITNELQTFTEVLTKNADASSIAINNIKIGKSSTCDASTEGNQRYNSVTKRMEFCNGTQWIPFTISTPCSPQPTAANAGTDQIDISGASVTLAANAPIEGTGKWTITGGTGGSFIENTLATTNFTGTAGEIYTLSWTISNDCYASSDYVTISFIAETVNDYNGNVYQTATIGNQIWMTENLKATHYSDGTPIPLVEDDTDWNNLGDNNTDKAYCYYHNNANNEANTYGVLYTWAAATNGISSSTNPSDVQGICPTGWHLPSQAEWTELTDYLGGASVAGGKLKETGIVHWNSPNTEATNESGFKALSGGMRQLNGYYNEMGERAYWWKTDENNSENAFYAFISYDSGSEQGYNTVVNKSRGYSVRCVKDSEVQGSIQINSPTIGGNWETSSTQNIIWTDNIDENVMIELFKNGTLLQTIIGSTPSNGIFSWSIPAGLTTRSDYSVKITSTVNSRITAQSANFTISASISLPTVTTNNATNVSYTTATCGGNVTENGGAAISARGVCWSTSQSPTLSDSYTTDETGTGTFTSNMTGLLYATTYYVRAYATNSVGTSYGEQKSLVTLAVAEPMITTNNVTNISYTNAFCGGNVTWDGNGNATVRGVCWSTSQNPTTSDNHSTDGSGQGSFTSNITGLNNNTTYYVRAYATNDIGTGYGEQKSFTTLNFETGTVTDYDNNTYNTVKIGNQWWMAENLKATHYADGTTLVLVEDNTAWGNLGDNDTDKAYCYYNNNANNEMETYGALYTWAAATNGISGSGVQGICPMGWHLPSDSEWKDLEIYLGISQTEVDNIGQRGNTEGGKLKESGTAHWEYENIGATNESSFTGLPSGARNHQNFDGGFYEIKLKGIWWLATEYNQTDAWSRYLFWSNAHIFRYRNSKSYGFSVRCIKD